MCVCECVSVSEQVCVCVHRAINSWGSEKKTTRGDSYSAKESLKSDLLSSNKPIKLLCKGMKPASLQIGIIHMCTTDNLNLTLKTRECSKLNLFPAFSKTQKAGQDWSPLLHSSDE